MDLKLLFLASYELCLAIIFGLATIFITYKIFNRLLLRADTDAALKEKNVAVGIFAGATILSIMLLVQSSISPAVEALHTMMLGGVDVTFKMVLISLGYFAMFYAISLSISILIMLLVLWIYLRVTVDIDEVKQVRESNVAVSVLISLVVVAMTLFIKPSVNHFISSLVNYESLESLPAEDPSLNLPSIPDPEVPVEMEEAPKMPVLPEENQ